MKIAQLISQAQCQLEDGSTVVITTPPLVPDEDATIESIRSTLMELGEDARQVMRQDSNSRILKANSNAVPDLRAFRP